MRRKLVIALVTVLFVGAAFSACAKTVTVDLTSQDVATYATPGDTMGTVIVLEIDLPAGVLGKRVDAVFLELFVDASFEENAAQMFGAPIEVYDLTASYSGQGVPQFSRASTRATRTVPVGESRRVFLDVTHLVKGWIAAPSSNHGLIIGSLTASRPGVFTLDTNAYDAGVIAKVKFYFQNR